MPNSTFFLRPAPYGNRAEMSGLGGGRIRWTMAPEVTWVCPVRHTDLAAAAAAGLVTQGTTITLEATSAVGRLVVSFTPRGGEAIEVAADLDPGDDQDDVIDALETAIMSEGDLDDYRDEASAAANVATVAWLAGVGLVDVSAEFEPAQVIDLRFDGTAAAGTYTYTFTGAGIVGEVVVDVPFAGGTAAELGEAVEAALESEVALDGIVLSANDDGSGNNSVQFAPGLPLAEIEVEVPGIPHSYELTTGGTPADGDYVATFHSDLLPAPVPVTVTRSAGSPSTSADIAAAFETAIESNPQLAPLVASANAAGAVNAIETFAGVTFTFTTSAPAGATLEVEDVSDPVPEYEPDDATPDAAVTVGHTLALPLNGLASRNAFPAHALRLESPLIRRVTAWSSAATITIDNAGEASTDVLTGVSVSSGTGWLGDTGTSLGSLDVPEVAWDPRLVITTADLAPTAGEFEIHVGFSPLPN